MLITRCHGARPRPRRRRVLVMDAREAHLRAIVERSVFVELPPETRRPGYCALLRRRLYGTRGAPARWEAYLAGEFRQMGF
eukprot:11188544-Lingulodinium_polyedra.AAC.1